MKRQLKIVFMGTPEFAVASLAKLVEHYNVVGVITAPDKPAGRGRQLQGSAVKKFAVLKGLKVLQPEKLKDPAFHEELRLLEANLFVVVAFRMLPEVVWSLPEYGTFNLHGSLLPQYRGAAPINWAVINGEKETGVTTFFIQKEIDTGDMILQEKVHVEETDTAGSLHDKLMVIGAEAVLRTVQMIEDGTVQAQPQPQNIEIKLAPKIFKEDCQINWDQPGKKVYDFIRGLSPYPAAFTTLDNKVFKIFSAQIEPISHNISPGNFISDNKSYLKFAVQDGFINCLEVQIEGKSRMKIKEFLLGFRAP